LDELLLIDPGRTSRIGVSEIAAMEKEGKRNGDFDLARNIFSCRTKFYLRTQTRSRIFGQRTVVAFLNGSPRMFFGRDEIGREES
jgi:hypothetical protein